MTAQHRLRLLGVPAGSITVGQRVLQVDDGWLNCPSDIPVRMFAEALHAQGLGADTIADIDPGLAAPCRLIRFDTHGTIFVIEERLPELIALLRLLQLESAVHKQGYEVERL